MPAICITVTVDSNNNLSCYIYCTEGFAKVDCACVAAVAHCLPQLKRSWMCSQCSWRRSRAVNQSWYYRRSVGRWRRCKRCRLAILLRLIRSWKHVYVRFEGVAIRRVFWDMLLTPTPSPCFFRGKNCCCCCTGCSFRQTLTEIFHWTVKGWQQLC